MYAMIANLRYALRQLRRSPGFTFTVVLTLALGVGANTVVFSVINALVLRPLALPHAEQLKCFNFVASGGSQSVPMQSWPDYVDLKERNHSFSDIAAMQIQPVAVSRGGAAEQHWTFEVSGNYFDMLGVQPLLGRFFHASDEHGPNGSPFVILRYDYWQRGFQGDPAIVGKVIQLNKHPFTVLGVAPKEFLGTELFIAPDLWAPIMNTSQLGQAVSFTDRAARAPFLFGRLKPGVTQAAAQADVDAIAAQLGRQYKEDAGMHLRLSRPGLAGEFLGNPIRAFLFGVMVLAGLVLVAACANLGSLFAARAADRGRELALRLALGASRRRLAGQLVMESLLVSLLGGAVGLAVALGMMHVLTLWRPSTDYPLQIAVAPDARVFGFALLLSVASGIFFGLVPLGAIVRTDAYSVIKSGGLSPSGTRRWTLRDLLLVTQIVLCSVLVTASLVAVRGLGRSLSASYGFEPQGALVADFNLKMAGQSDASSLPLQHRALDALAALPGVTAAGLSDRLPLSLATLDADIFRDGATDFRTSQSIADAYYYSISPGYLNAARTMLLAGRDFTWHDEPEAPRVAIVNRAFAKKVFGTEAVTNAIGHYFVSDAHRILVVGVVEDGKYFNLTEAQEPAMFLPVAQAPNGQSSIIVRGRADLAGNAALPDEVRRTLRAIDPGVPVKINPWPQAMSMATFPSVAASATLGVMGALAALLAVTGIFGMASYSVSKRLRELGIRVALGAQRREVLTAALGRPARLLVLGSVVGLALGAAASSLLAHIVYQATPRDPLVLLGVAGGMALIALTAAWLPARRALLIDPATLLREE